MSLVSGEPNLNHNDVNVWARCARRRLLHGIWWSDPADLRDPERVVSREKWARTPATPTTIRVWIPERTASSKSSRPRRMEKTHTRRRRDGWYAKYYHSLRRFISSISQQRMSSCFWCGFSVWPLTNTQATPQIQYINHFVNDPDTFERAEDLFKKFLIKSPCVELWAFYLTQVR